jgi:hypothetical protein
MSAVPLLVNMEHAKINLTHINVTVVMDTQAQIVKQVIWYNHMRWGKYLVKSKN